MTRRQAFGVQHGYLGSLITSAIYLKTRTEVIERARSRAEAMRREMEVELLPELEKEGHRIGRTAVELVAAYGEREPGFTGSCPPGWDRVPTSVATDLALEFASVQCVADTLERIARNLQFSAQGRGV